MKKTLFPNRLLVFGAVFMLAAFLAVGCGSDKDGSEADKMSDEASLPDDFGDETMLDTSTTAEDMTAPEKEVVVAPKEQPKPKPKPQPKPEPKPEPKPKPQIVRTTILPENTAMKVKMLTKVATGENKVGDRFRAALEGPADKNQSLNLPAGTVFEGVVADLSDGTAEGEKAFVQLRFTDIIMPGEEGLPVEGYIMTEDSSGAIRPGGQATSIARDGGIGAVLGGVIGAVTGKKGDKTENAAKGAVIGGVVGGVAGAVLHKDQVTLKEGTTFNIILVSGVVKETVKR